VDGLFKCQQLLQVAGMLYACSTWRSTGVHCRSCTFGCDLLHRCFVNSYFLDVQAINFGLLHVCVQVVLLSQPASSSSSSSGQLKVARLVPMGSSSREELRARRSNLLLTTAPGGRRTGSL
jgi:hypothetical protein